ncbi:MAG: class I SAM-dependent methyltransferase [Saprospiraceae bacterium]
MQGLIDKFLRHYRNPINAAKEGYCLQLLRPLMEDFGYIPIANSSLSFHTLATACNDIVYNERKQVIEFGAGISTLVFAKLIQTYELDTRIISVEHNKNWIHILESYLDKAGVSGIVEFIHAEKGPSPLALEGNTWYQMEPHMDKIEGRLFDSVLVDGPEAHQSRIRMSRYPALPFIAPYMHPERCFVCLDDSYRSGEKRILKKWSADFKLDFHIKVGSSHCAIRGDFFNPIA